MIVRLWSARATSDNVAAYLHHFHASVLPALSALPGFLGASILEERPVGEDATSRELIVLTRWQSMDAIRAFAGESPERAVVEPAAAAVLTAFDQTVRHFTVAVEQSAAAATS